MTKKHKLVNHTPSFKIHDVHGCISLHQEHSGLQRCLHCFSIIMYTLNFLLHWQKSKLLSPSFQNRGSMWIWQHRGAELLSAKSTFKCSRLSKCVISLYLTVSAPCLQYTPKRVTSWDITVERGRWEMKSCSWLPDSLHRESSSHPPPSTFPARSRMSQRGRWLLLLLYQKRISSPFLFIMTKLLHI